MTPSARPIAIIVLSRIRLPFILERRFGALLKDNLPSVIQFAPFEFVLESRIDDIAEEPFAATHRNLGFNDIHRLTRPRQGDIVHPDA